MHISTIETDDKIKWHADSNFSMLGDSPMLMRLKTNKVIILKTETKSTSIWDRKQGTSSYEQNKAGCSTKFIKISNTIWMMDILFGQKMPSAIILLPVDTV